MLNKFKSFITFPSIIIIIVAALVSYSQSLPLIKTFNFEYSAFVAILLFISAGLLTIYYLRKYKSIGILLPMLLMKNKVYLFLLLLPLILSFIFNILFQNCPISKGLLFYFLISVPSLYFGFVCGVLSFFISKKFSYLLFVGSLLLFIMLPLIEFYYNPQIYFYNPIIGIFPGTIYDEDISITNSLILYRVFNLFFFSLVLWVMTKIGNKKSFNRYLFLSLIAITSITWMFTKQYIGFSSTPIIIEKNLKGKALTPYYKIIYPVSIEDDKKRLIVLEHEYYYQSLIYKTKLKPSELITSFIFKDGDQKRKLFGTKAANVAKPWLSQIYLDQHSLSGTLEHELTHIFAAEIGSTILKITPNFNFALLEGYAMAMENDYSGFDLDYLAVLGMESGYKIMIEELFSKLNFFGAASSVSYIYAGSFIKYLIQVYGIDKVNLIYQDHDFEKHIGRKLNELSIEYNNHLESLDYPINSNRANYFFGYKPLIAKTCPREVADDIKEAWQKYSNENYIEAKEYFSKIYSYSKSFSSLLGIVNCNSKIGKEKESKQLLENALDDYKGTSYYFSTLLNYGDQLALTDEIEKADSIYTFLGDMIPTIRYYNLALTRKAMISEGKGIIINYLQGSDFDKYEIIKEINRNKLLEPSISIMVELSSRLNENIYLFTKYLNQIDNLDETISSNTAYVLSDYFYQNYKMDQALQYAQLSIDKCKESYRISILQSHKNKIEWIMQHQNEILSKTKFSIVN